jgi:hypothetical protein
MWLVSLLAYALPSALVMYALGALVAYKLRLTKITKIAGFFIAWPITAITALLMANETTILSAEKEIFPAAAIGAIIAVSGIALAGRRNTPVNHSSIPLQTVIDEERVYAEIAQELETGIADKGLWTRLFAESGGDDKQTKVLYIKQRSECLITAERLRLEQAQDSRKPTEESQIESPVVAVKRDEQVTGIDWLEQVTGLNWLKEVFFCVLLLFVIFIITGAYF